MKKLSLFAFFIIALASCGPAFADDTTFRHIVYFKFTEDATEAQVKEIETAFIALAGKIETVTDFEWGTSQSIEELNDEFTHCFMVTFKDKAGLEAYLPHPDHKKFVQLLKPKLDKVFVFDYSPH